MTLAVRPENSTRTGPSDQAPDVVRHLAHEIRQPLSAIESLAYYLDMVLPRHDRKSRAQVEKIQAMVQQANWILADAVYYLNASPPRPETLDLNEVVAGSIAEWSRERLDVRLRLELQPALVVLDPNRARHMLRNLFHFLRQAAQPGTPVDLWMCEGEDLDGRSCVQLELSCQTPVHPAASDLVTQARSLFDPFASHAPAGSGLGLASVKQIILAAGGSLEVYARQADMLVAGIRIPRAR
ncbi:MAG: hypothetical protein FJW40_20045 [Acidobacteria bacterium]|nr:hypothetical protein [Acidobacteriota bacterium]